MKAYIRVGPGLPDSTDTHGSRGTDCSIVRSASGSTRRLTLGMASAEAMDTVAATDTGVESDMAAAFVAALLGVGSMAAAVAEGANQLLALSNKGVLFGGRLF